MAKPDLAALHQRALALEEAVASALRLSLTPARGETTRWHAHARVRAEALAHPAQADQWRESERLRWQIALSEHPTLRRRAARGGGSIDDVVADTLEHLFHAAVIWQPERGAFATAARAWIRVGVQRAPSRAGVVHRAGRLGEAHRRALANGQCDDAQLIAGEVTADALKLDRHFEVVSLDAPRPGSRDLFVEQVADPGDPEEAAHLAHLGRRVCEAIRIAAPAAPLPVALYLQGVLEDLATAALARKAGVSRERVRVRRDHGLEAIRFVLRLSDGTRLPPRTYFAVRRAIALGGAA